MGRKPYMPQIVSEIATWTDYVFITKSRGENVYHCSDTKKDGYFQRVIMMAMGSDGRYYVAAATGNDRNNKGRAWSDELGKVITSQRLKKLVSCGDVLVEYTEVPGHLYPKVSSVKGQTVVPKEYLDLLWSDVSCYSNIYGPIPESAVVGTAKKLISGANRPTRSKKNRRKKTRKAAG